MDQQTLLGVLTAFTFVHRQMLITLELLMNENKRLPQTSFDTRHRIRQLAYFRMIHEFDLVCHESTLMDRIVLGIGCDVHKGERAHSRSTFVQNTEGGNCDECTRRLRHERGFCYVLIGWKGSVADSRILKDALAEKMDCKGQRYHLQEWRDDGNALTTAKEYFNMKHSSARHVIERYLVFLRVVGAILRGSPTTHSKCSVAQS
ncbi:putative nuclease HARBI1 [Cucumis melo var. makuwa]|uniref:Nuclease HARBI1 n=1 Tax=Cucumis melo var. makuwa TaxID=1194695 RepID=A0A5D3DRU2_CUCMM|nr:putative nuclease HARBI1 [Cucumis melo var. makuwa]TYK26222.1 putative nuclease HARBI1 [Cucumis melo var. makuwa]